MDWDFDRLDMAHLARYPAMSCFQDQLDFPKERKREPCPFEDQPTFR